MTATERTPRLPWAGPAVERRRDSDNAAEVVPRGLRVTAAIGWRLLVVAAALWVLGQIIAYLSGIVIPVAGTMTLGIRHGSEVETSQHGSYRFVPLL